MSQALRSKRFLILKVTSIVQKSIFDVGMLTFAIINTTERKGILFFFFPVEAGRRRQGEKEESDSSQSFTSPCTTGP